MSPAFSRTARGAHTLVVEDFAEVHNVHLSGAGVDAATDVSRTGKKTSMVCKTAHKPPFDPSDVAAKRRLPRQEPNASEP